MAALSLSPQVFAILTSLIEERCGIHYSLADRDLLAEKISPRAMDGGFDSLLDYYYFLRYDPGGEPELQALVETLTVHETYFFREFDQLEVLVRDILAPLVAAGRRPRVWCAAASTGEEPLTLAMLLDDCGLLHSVSIVASDVSSRAIARAQQGVFGRRSLRAIPRQALVDRYLVSGTDGQHSIVSRLPAAIEWRLVNLMDQRAIAALGTFDAILCRNVLIYFRDQTARAVVDRLCEALTPGGTLVVGVSESLLRFGTALVCEERGGAFLYRKAT